MFARFNDNTEQLKVFGHRVTSTQMVVAIIFNIPQNFLGDWTFFKSQVCKQHEFLLPANGFIVFGDESTNFFFAAKPYGGGMMEWPREKRENIFYCSPKKKIPPPHQRNPPKKEFFSPDKLTQTRIMGKSLIMNRFGENFH